METGAIQAMKMYNHKQVLNILYGATQQLSTDPRDRGVRPDTLIKIVEILNDCGCETCRKLSQGFRVVQGFVDRGDIQAASMAMTATCQNIGLLNIPQNVIAN